MVTGSKPGLGLGVLTRVIWAAGESLRLGRGPQRTSSGIVPPEVQKMEFGLQFFPDVGPEVKRGQQYWNECLDLAEICDSLGYSHVRTLEHYFEVYGGTARRPTSF